MMDQATTLRRDDKLLQRERGIRLGNLALVILFLWYLVPYLYVVASDDGKSDSFFNVFGLLVFFLIARIQDLHLKHIASIKLYRTKVKESQQHAGGDSGPAA